MNAYSNIDLRAIELRTLPRRKHYLNENALYLRAMTSLLPLPRFRRIKFSCLTPVTLLAAIFKFCVDMTVLDLRGSWNHEGTAAAVEELGAILSRARRDSTFSLKVLEVRLICN